jgi:hypothetical protein
MSVQPTTCRAPMRTIYIPKRQIRAPEADISGEVARYQLLTIADIDPCAATGARMSAPWMQDEAQKACATAAFKDYNEASKGQERSECSERSCRSLLHEKALFCALPTRSA